MSDAMLSRAVARTNDRGLSESEPCQAGKPDQPQSSVAQLEARLESLSSEMKVTHQWASHASTPQGAWGSCRPLLLGSLTIRNIQDANRHLLALTVERKAVKQALELHGATISSPAHKPECSINPCVSPADAHPMPDTTGIGTPSPPNLGATSLLESGLGDVPVVDGDSDQTLDGPEHLTASGPISRPCDTRPHTIATLNELFEASRPEGSEHHGPLLKMAMISTPEKTANPGQIKTHKQHNKEIHAMVGNTTSSLTAFKLASITDADGNPKLTHPGPRTAQEQWKAWGELWASWWIAGGVQGTGKDPFVYFPETFAFAQRIITPDYTKRTWKLLLPVMVYTIQKGEVEKMFNGEPSIDLTTANVRWIWPGGKPVAQAMLNGISKKGAEIDKERVDMMMASTPSLGKDIKDSYTEIRQALNRIMNPVTALRDPRFNEVKRRYTQMMVAKQEEVDKARLVYERLRDELVSIQEERDEALRKLDPNMKGGLMTIERQLEELGLQDNPVLASDAQKNAKPIPLKDPGKSPIADFDPYAELDD